MFLVKIAVSAGKTAVLPAFASILVASLYGACNVTLYAFLRGIKFYECLPCMHFYFYLQNGKICRGNCPYIQALSYKKHPPVSFLNQAEHKASGTGVPKASQPKFQKISMIVRYVARSVVRYGIFHNFVTFLDNCTTLGAFVGSCWRSSFLVLFK